MVLGGLVLIALVVFFGIAPRVADRRLNPVAAPPPYEASAEARAVHETLFVADLHADFLLWSRDLLDRHDYGHLDLPRLVEGNVGLQVFAAVTKVPRGQNYAGNTDDSDRLTPLVIAQRWPVSTWSSPRERALHQARRLHGFASRAGEAFTIIETRSELDRFLARREHHPGRVAGLLAIEGLHALERDPANVDTFFEAGYRMMGLAHFFDTAVSGSAHGVEQGGLTPMGRQVVRRMEELGVVVDLAHASPAAIDDVLEMAARPVVVSHTGVRATCPGPRNLSDAHIRGVARTGGLVGVGFWEGAVCEASPAAIARAMRHVADLVGADHVGLGSDFDGTVEPPFDATGLPQITEALMEAGFDQEELGAVMGGNVLRVLRETLPQ